MEKTFKNNSTHSRFSWAGLGNIKEGRGDLGEDMPVLVYRLMQYTMLDVLTMEFGRNAANEFFRAAGRLAGGEFAKNVLDSSLSSNEFFSRLQKVLQEQRIGILRLEHFDTSSGEIILTVGQDLDCSGLPVSNETVCDYDEGFFAGILEYYFKKPYNVKEIDCWANGDRVCRFRGTTIGD